jgi:diguanylate cyclase (GGDEF)-like protein
MAMALSVIRNDTGPRASAALRAFERDPASGRFETVIERLVSDGLTGTTSSLTTDIVAIGAALTDGVAWIDRLTSLVGAAAADLGTAASASAADNLRGFRIGVLVATLATIVSSLAVAALARSIARPLRRIADAARAVHDGSFDLPALEASGPRELADAAVAINEMALTLGAVESRALALTGATDARTAFAPLPGRTGRALDAALDQLHDLATHDGLTALLNRNAALDAIGRDFARGRRDGQPVMALFLDLDGLKAINDVHGHSTGDAAIAFVADVLGRVCRDSDVVARVGGDEFLIAGLAPGGRDEAEALAERIRTEMRATMMRVRDVEIPVRCSVGVAIVDPLSSSVEALLADADAAMYQAKLAGRPT